MYTFLLTIIPLTAAIKMHYTWLIKVTILFSFFSIKCLTCHLKDLGEAKTNWTHVLQKMEKRIVGGHETTLYQHPYSVQFYNYGGLCGGSILTKKTVLTAAHCFDSNVNLAEMRIFTKSRYLFDLQAISHDVWDFIIHERYGEEIAFDNDIAVILIHDEFVFDPQVQKATITDSKLWATEDQNENFTVSGWGEVKYGVSGKYFRETYLHYTNRDTCMKINQVKLSPGMFCLFGDGERDTCRGDSGGGVLWKGELVGIVSHGRGCGSMPGVYTNVFSYKSWIYQNIKKMYNHYCDFHKKGAYCVEIHNSSNEMESRIIGGWPVSIEDFPFAIQFFNYQGMCSGVILNSFTMLTSAHCFDYNIDIEYMVVEINKRYLSDANAENYEVDKFVVHEDYNRVIPFEADIALIFVRGNIDLDHRKQRAILVNNNNWMNEKANISAIGWGWTKYGGSLSKLGLMQTNLRYVSRQRCEHLHNLSLSADMFCLYGDGKRDTCRGDSGGGVSINGTVIGIVSHGDGCAKKDKPSVYISVSYHRRWIEAKILKVFKDCQKSN